MRIAQYTESSERLQCSHFRCQEGLQTKLFNRQERQEKAGKGHFTGFFLGALGVLGGSFCFFDFAVLLDSLFRGLCRAS